MGHCNVFVGLGCKALRVTEPDQIEGALRQTQQKAQRHRVPVVVECIVEKVTNIAMGTAIDNVMEFEEIDCRHPEGGKGLEMAGLLK